MLPQRICSAKASTTSRSCLPKRKILWRATFIVAPSWAANSSRYCLALVWMPLRFSWLHREDWKERASPYCIGLFWMKMSTTVPRTKLRRLSRVKSWSAWSITWASSTQRLQRPCDCLPLSDIRRRVPISWWCISIIREIAAGSSLTTPQRQKGRVRWKKMALAEKISYVSVRWVALLHVPATVEASAMMTFAIFRRVSISSFLSPLSISLSFRVDGRRARKCRRKSTSRMDRAAPAQVRSARSKRRKDESVPPSCQCLISRKESRSRGESNLHVCFMHIRKSFDAT